MASTGGLRSRGTLCILPTLFGLLLAALATAAEPGLGSLRPASAPPPGQNQRQPQQPAAAPAPLIELDGTISISPDGSELSYSWKQVSGPKVELSDPTAAKPYFRTNKPGVYEFQLVVSANGLSSEPHIVRLEIEHENLPPVAKIPAEAFGQVEKVIEIDGRQSFDPEGQSLIYRWRPLTPGLDIPLSALSMPILSFEPKKDGVFEVELIVSDGEKASLPALCRVTVKPKPRPPVAQARIITIGVQPGDTADARSADKSAGKKPSRPVAQVKAVPPPNKAKTSQVTVTSMPTPPAVTEAKVVASSSGSPGMPSAAVTTANVTATSVAAAPRVPGTASGLTPYAAINGNAAAAPAEIKKPAEKKPPEPASLPPIRTPVDSASASMPPLPPLPGESAWSGDANWTPSLPLPAAPAASSLSVPVAPISVPPLSASEPSGIDPDLLGIYSEAAVEAEPLYASGPDSYSSASDYSGSALYEPSPMMPPAQPAKPRYDVMSAPMTTLPFDRPRPQARIKGPKIAMLGNSVLLDARESSNSAGVDISGLEYTWRQKRGPEPVDMEPLFGGAGRSFSSRTPGTYEFELVVTNGGVQSAPVSHAVRFTDESEPPVAVVVAPTRARLGALVTMDATQSYDITGSKLIYRWRQTGGPSVRNYVIDERLGESAPAYYPPAPGRYSFELIVSNGKQNSRPVEIDVEVEARLAETAEPAALPAGAGAAPELTVEGPGKAVVGESVVLDAMVRGGEGRGLSFAWRQKDGPADALTPSSGTRAVASPVRAGKYVFEVTMLEKGEALSSADVSLEVTEKSARSGLAPLPQVAGGAPYIGPSSGASRSGNSSNAGGAPARTASTRVPSLAPLPNTPAPPPISSFPPPTLPDGGRGRPAAKVLQTGKPPLADL